MSSYLNQYTERIVCKFLRNQKFDWIPEEQIHKAFEQPWPRGDEGGVSIAQRKTPLIEVKCEQANPVLPSFRGNWDVMLDLCIINSVQDVTDEVHEDRVKQVLSLFYNDTIVSDLIAVNPAFWCAKIIPGQTTIRIEGTSFSSSAQFTLVSACAAAMK